MAATDVSLGTVIVPTMPQGFEASCMALNSTRRDYQLPGTTAGVGAFGTIMVETNSMPTANAPVRLLVSPVQNPTIEGQPLANDVSGVGSNPTISWSTPDVGSPSGYIVRLYSLSVNGTATKANPIARFYTADTSMTVPPNLMAVGGTYYVKISAYSSQGWNPDVSPYRNAKAIPYGFADCLSGIVRP
jgi:hypothetical protein